MRSLHFSFFFFFLGFFLFVESRVNFEKDGVYSGRLRLPDYWEGALSSVYRPTTSLTPPSKREVVHNKLYSITSPNSYTPGAIYISNPQEYSTQPNVISFTEQRYSFAASPTEDISILTTLEGTTLKLLIIDSTDYFVFTNEVVVSPNLVQELFTSFLSTRFMLIEIKIVGSIKRVQFVYDKVNDELKQLSALLPFSISDEDSYAISTFSSSIRVIYASTGLSNSINVMSFNCDKSGPLNFTMEWNATIKDPSATRVMIHTGLNMVVVSSRSSFYCLDFPTGRQIFQETDTFPKQLVGNVKPVLFVGYSNRIEAKMFDHSSFRSVVILEDFYKFVSMRVGQFGDVYTAYYNICCSEYQARLGVISPHGVFTRIYYSGATPTLFIPTDRYILFAYNSGTYSIYTPVVVSPTSAPYYPTYHYYYEERSFWEQNAWFRVVVSIFAAMAGCILVVWLLLSYLRYRQRRHAQQQHQDLHSYSPQTPAVIHSPVPPPDYMLIQHSCSTAPLVELNSQTPLNQSPVNSYSDVV